MTVSFSEHQKTTGYNPEETLSNTFLAAAEYEYDDYYPADAEERKRDKKQNKDKKGNKPGDKPGGGKKGGGASKLKYDKFVRFLRILLRRG